MLCRGDSMIRKAHIFQLYQGKRAEHERAHNPIWPQLEAVLKAYGAHNYSIFLHEASNLLFCQGSTVRHHRNQGQGALELRRADRGLPEVVGRDEIGDGNQSR